MVLYRSINPGSVIGVPSDAQTLSHAKEFILTVRFQVTGMQKLQGQMLSAWASPQAIASYFHFQMPHPQLGNYYTNVSVSYSKYITMAKNASR